jgi:hypothetical protein
MRCHRDPRDQCADGKCARRSASPQRQGETDTIGGSPQPGCASFEVVPQRIDPVIRFQVFFDEARAAPRLAVGYVRHRTDQPAAFAQSRTMPTSPPANATSAAYALEATTWLALKGHIPGHPMHDPAAWSAWRSALHAALKNCAENGPYSTLSYQQKNLALPVRVKVNRTGFPEAPTQFGIPTWGQDGNYATAPVPDRTEVMRLGARAGGTGWEGLIQVQALISPPAS